MPARRYLFLWFPRLAAERIARREGLVDDAPLAVVEDSGQMQVLFSLSATATAAGLRPGQPLRDAQAMCPSLRTRLRNPHAEAAFLAALRRWAGRFSPLVGEERPDGLILDITGCAHLFGSEGAMIARAGAEAAGLGLTVLAGIADTPRAARALARHAHRDPETPRTGEAIDAEARATRSRAHRRRHWERGGPLPVAEEGQSRVGRIAPPGQTRTALAPLPVAALGLDAETREALARVGLRRIGDLAGQPRAALARRFGTALVQRLDQALGAAPEPISPIRATPPLAVRITFPEPIGLEADVMAAIDRLLPRLCTRLAREGRGARMLRLECWRTDGTMQWAGIGLARASHDPDRLRPLLAMKVPEIDAGFGIDMIRLEVTRAEAVHARRPVGHLEAGRTVAARLADANALDDLIGRIGARIGLERITRRHPSDSHIPEKCAQTLAAAWSEPARAWPEPPRPRPLLLWRPEPVDAPADPVPPRRFRWRGRVHLTAEARGPERIAPEWWLDEPDWRSGVRDYWQIVTGNGDRLWLYYAHGAALSPGWFCQGAFA